MSRGLSCAAPFENAGQGTAVRCGGADFRLRGPDSILRARFPPTLSVNEARRSVVERGGPWRRRSDEFFSWRFERPRKNAPVVCPKNAERDRSRDCCSD